MEWLNGRFRLVDAHGVYQPHQPVYGINISDPKLMGTFNQLCLTYTILLVLADLDNEVQTLLDVGCAEGYTAHTLANLLFNGTGFRAFGLDLSVESVLRAQSLYQLPGVVGDIHCLPFRSNAAHLVICSETIEHVVNAQQTLRELDRISKNVLLITTPANWDPEA